MRKTLTYILKSLPFLVLLLILAAVSPAHAGWWSDLKDAAVDAAGEAAAWALGIDTEDNCVPPTSETTSCLFCPMFKILFNAGSIVAAKSYSAFSSELGQLVLVFLSVSLALIILRNIAAMGSKDPGALLNDIFKKTFVCIVIYIIIAKDYYNVLNLTLTPIFETGFSFVKSGNTTCASAGGVIGYSGTSGSGGAGGLPMNVGASIVCAVEDIERKINMLFEFGKWAFCRGNGPDRIFHIIPNPIYLIDGILLYLAGIFFMVAYPWVMGDAVLQFGVAMAIAPFAVCGYAFDGTKRYLPKVFSWILHSLFTFMFMAILILCILGYINDLLGAALAKGAADPKVVFTDPNQGIAFYGPNMLKIIFILVIGWAYMPVVSDLAGNFSGGSGLNAAGKIGSAVKNTVDAKTRKAADWGVGVAGNAAKAAGRVTARRAKAGVRRGMMFGVNRFGARNASGGKTIKMLGYTFATEKGADGSQVLRREFTSITGRRHVMISDKYSTIKQEYTKSGKQVKNETTFKHGFALDHLLDEQTGNINIGAIQTLLNSPLGQKPEYRKAIMSQLAVQVAKARGDEVGTYYRSRNIKFDPNNPYNIIIEQVDNTGKITSLSMKIDEATGQTAIDYFQDRSPNRFEAAGTSLNQGRKKMGRKINIAAVNTMIQKAGHDNHDGTYSWDSAGGLVSYTAKTDASGQKYYEREAKKYLFFGPKIKKTYDINGVEMEYDTHKKREKHLKKMTDIENKLNSASHATTTASGGKAALIGNAAYVSRRDAASGKMFYTKIEVVSHFVTKETTYYDDRVVIEYKNEKGDTLDSSVEYIDEQKNTRKNVDGSGSVSYGSSAGTTYSEDFESGAKYNSHYKRHFSNGMVDITTTGVSTGGDIRKGGVKTTGETTLFKYSAYAQQGHDSVIDKMDGNQIVEKDGTIAADLDPVNAGKDWYKGDLLFGMDEFSGITTLNGKSAKDYVHQDIFANGRNRDNPTNKLKTHIDWTMDSFYVADDNGNIIGRADGSGTITGNSGARIGSVSGGIAYDSTGRPIGHVI